MSGGDDDEPTSSRGKPPRAPIVPAQAPDRPTIPQLGRVPTRRGVDVAKARAGEPDPLDDGPTVFDPEMPAGMRAPNRDQRPTAPRIATTPPVVITDEDEPTGAKAPLATVIGKRPKARPVSPVDHLGTPFGSAARPGDSSRTNRWDAPEAIERPHRDSGHPTNPLDPRSRESGPPTNPLPVRGAPRLPLAPGPRSAQIHAVSMKAAHEVDEDKAARPLPEVRIRAMSELHSTPARGMGYLAPPRDPSEERSRRRRDLAIWGSVSIIVAAVVTLLVWFVAR